MQTNTQWLHWMRDYISVAEKFIFEEPIATPVPKEAELLSIKTALFGRALAMFDSTALLLEHNHQLDFRIHARGVIEAAMYLIALDRDPAFVEKMKDDDFKSRQARANIRLAEVGSHLNDDVRALHEEFVAQGAQGTKYIQISDLLSGSHFTRLYSTYRDICGDAAHVSIMSLKRHYIEDPDTHLGELIVHPDLSEGEVAHTMIELGVSILLATSMIMKTKQQTKTWDQLRGLIMRYNELVLQLK